MRLVVDTNRFISALLRAGSTRRAFVETESELFAPVDVLDEIARHRAALVSRSGLTFLAAALAIGADAIWSEDKHFDVQTLVPRTRHPDRIER